jgi:nucleoside-diphosphate-sugar epimerase
LDKNKKNSFHKAVTLVTGGNGFIGSHIIRRIAAHEAYVVVIVRENSNLWRLEQEINNIEIVKLDLLDKNELISCIKEFKPEYVFHMAAYGVDQRNNDHIEAINTNVIGTINLLEALSGVGCRKIINAGTGMEYGCFEGQITEHTRLKPNNIYGSSKAAAALIAHQIAKEMNMNIVTLRPFGIFGEYESHSRLFAHIILSILKGTDIKLTGCEQYKDYTYVGNIVDGFLMVALDENLQNEIFNIGSGDSYQLKYYIELILNCLGTDNRPIFGAVPYRAHDLCEVNPDISKIKRLVGWEPAVSLEDGIRKTVRWFKDNIDLY